MPGDHERLGSSPESSAGRVNLDELADCLEKLYEAALDLVDRDAVDKEANSLGALGTDVDRLAKIKHAARGCLLTLSLYKCWNPDQDIRFNKAEHEGGFSARVVDSAVTVPMLRRESLPRSVESHWLTQTFSFADPWTRAVTLKTTPKECGPLLIDSVNLLEELPRSEQRRAAEIVARIILARLIQSRNNSRVTLTRPKGLTVGEVKSLLSGLVQSKFKTGAPRIPQLIIYAMYESIFHEGFKRYRDCELEPLGRMKAADRKAGTVGDIVVSRDSRPMEAVETKFDVPITASIVAEAMEKVKSLSVERYLILSTSGVDPLERKGIDERVSAFKSSNGCEVIVNGVLETVSYYLRLLPNTNVYVEAFADLLETDPELDYEHRVAWNELCATR